MLYNYTGQCYTGCKIPFTLKGGRFSGEYFLRYLDLCYVLSAVNNQKLQEIDFAKSALLWGKGYFAAVGTFF